MKANVLLVGPSGTGKTRSLRTLAPHRKTLIIATEPGIQNIVGPDSKEGDLHGQVHWHYIPPAAAGWDRLLDNATKINSFGMDVLQKMQGLGKQDYQQFMELLNSCANFTCDECGEVFGPIDDLDESFAVAVDGLSGVNIMGMNLVTGAKPIKTMPEWGCAMDNIENLIIKWTTGLKCSFILTAHVEREIDEVSGGTQKTVSTLGRKLAPKIPRFFDEVVLTVREGKEFSWSTAELNTDLKARLLPLADGIRPDFGLIFGDK
jgi:hypothetical protein